MPLASDGAPCPYCLGKGIAHFEKIIRLGIFDDPLKHLIHQAKYHRRWPIFELLADRLFETERAKGLLTETKVLVPVPLHFRRHLSRGYNQADVIARRVCWRNGDVSVVNALRRVRDTETQTHLHSHEKRLANVRGAFALRRRFASKIRGKHVMLIDDVMTTGSTLRSAARILRRAKPASLCAMVLAIADPKHRGFEAK
jgi:ComF family protein